MVKKSDLDALFYSVKHLDVEPESETIIGLAEAVGKAKIKNKVLELMIDWYQTLSHGKVIE